MHLDHPGSGDHPAQGQQSFTAGHPGASCPPRLGTAHPWGSAGGLPAPHSELQVIPPNPQTRGSGHLSRPRLSKARNARSPSQGARALEEDSHHPTAWCPRLRVRNPAGSGKHTAGDFRCLTSGRPDLLPQRQAHSVPWRPGSGEAGACVKPSLPCNRTRSLPRRPYTCYMQAGPGADP